MNEILEYLTIHGEATDSQIAEQTGILLPDVRLYLSELISKQKVLACRSIRFDQDQEVAVTICRLIGYIPAKKPGKRPKLQLDLSWGNRQRTLL